MHFFLRDNYTALKEFQEASAMVYNNKAYKPEESKNVNTYLDGLLADYLKFIQNGQKPQNEMKIATAP